jgi:hypothetical protein
MTELPKDVQDIFEREFVEVIARYHGLFHPEWRKRVISVSGNVDWYYSPEIYELVNKDLEALFKKAEFEKR